MKKIKLFLLMTLLVFAGTQVQAETGKNIAPVTNPTESATVTILVNRLREIDAMDKTTMKGSEKRALRKEVRLIDKELKTLNDGVYLSVGAIIIIILLLIILL